MPSLRQPGRERIYSIKLLCRAGGAAPPLYQPFGLIAAGLVPAGQRCAPVVPLCTE